MLVKHLLRVSPVGSSLLLMGLVANAQERERIVVIEKEYHQTTRGDDWWRRPPIPARARRSQPCSARDFAVQC